MIETSGIIQYYDNHTDICHSLPFSEVNTAPTKPTTHAVFQSYNQAQLIAEGADVGTVGTGTDKWYADY